jgi:hypothetical protein
MRLQDIPLVLSGYPSLCSLNLDNVSRFIRLSCLSKPTIEWSQTDTRFLSPTLPSNVLCFLANSIPVVPGVQENLIIMQECWSAFRFVVWAHEEITATEDEINLFNKFGLSQHICKWLRIAKNQWYDTFVSL